jgi:hypothetical protein
LNSTSPEITGGVAARQLPFFLFQLPLLSYNDPCRNKA